MSKLAPYTSTYDISTTYAKPKMKHDHRYDTLRNLDKDTDHHHDSESSTEVEESDVENKAQPSRRQRRRKGVWAKVKKYRWIVDTALLLVIVGLLVEKRWSKHHNAGKKQKGHRYELAGDITGFAPTCEFSKRDMMGLGKR